MKQILLLILLAIIFMWAFKKLLESIFNLQALMREKKQPGSLPRTVGMVLNKKTGKLEADSRTILPF